MVIFKKREDAESAVAQFHNRTLDGTPMHVEIVEGPKPRLDGVRGRGPSTVGGGSGSGGGSTWRGKRPSCAKSSLIVPWNTSIGTRRFVFPCEGGVVYFLSCIGFRCDRQALVFVSTHFSVQFGWMLFTSSSRANMKAFDFLMNNT